jgi:PAS domain S-box-containing protein
VQESPLWMGTDHQVGTGWNAAVAIWHAGKHLGWLVADNLVKGQPANPYQLDIMAQYGVLVGSVLARKTTEQILRDNDWKHRQIFEHMGAGITMYDVAGKLIYVNDRICEIVGYSREELLEHGVGMTIDPDFEPIFDYHGDLRDQGLYSSYELRLIRKDKQRVMILVHGSPQYDVNGTLIGSFAVSTDISAQKEAEDTLRRALVREQELAQIQSQFVATTSHEFRTPLAIVLATTETLQQYRDQMNTDQINMRLERIRSQVYHLRQIMDDVLNLYSMQHRRREFAPKMGDIRILFEEIATEFRGSMDFVDRLRVHIPEKPIEMPYEKRVMRQIMQNLISNALKYSPQELPVDLTLKQENGDMVIQVQDYGIGVPEESMRRLFEPFYRATNVGKISGTGLGLVIVKESVEIHGGTLAIDSVVNQGTLVTIRIPMQSKNPE